MRGYRSAIFHCLSDPRHDGGRSWVYHADGLLLVDGGHVVACGPYADLAGRIGSAPVETYPGRLITPGFVDLHIHLPQIDCIAAHGRQLLDWLDHHVFPAEAAFADPVHAAAAARFFIAQLLSNGTTTAMVFGSSHKTSVDALFAEALAANMRLIAGKVLMDRLAPADLLDGPDHGRRETLELIAAWSRKGRLGYAVTPRFAVTSSESQLALAGEILAAYPDVWLQTHLAENRAEVAEVARLFPDTADYLALYERFGLVGPRSVFAHCVQMDEAAFARMARAGASAAFCPTSNLFLGSGLFNLEGALARDLKVGVGTDIGAGTTLSILNTLSDAYKVGQLRGETLDPFQAFYLATLGGARTLGLDGKIGNLAAGKEADFLVLDPDATPLLSRRLACAKTPADQLFALMILGDDRVVERTFVAGVERWRRDRQPYSKSPSSRASLG